MSYFMQEEFYKVHTNEILHTSFSTFLAGWGSNNEALIIWVPRYERALDFEYLIFIFILILYLSKVKRPCWSIWLVVRSQGCKSPQFDGHTKDKYFGSWLWNLGQECNLQQAWRQSCWQVSWSSPMLPKMVSWSSPMLRRWREPEIFPPGATEVLAWLRERTFTGEKLWGRARCLVPLFYGRTPLSGRLSCKNFTPSTAVEWRRAEKDRTGNYGWSWYFCTRFMKPAFTRI